MPVLDTFALPGRIDDDLPAGRRRDELHERWQQVVGGMFEALSGFGQLYDPTVTDTPEGSLEHPVMWPAFPAKLNRLNTTAKARAALADGSRDLQDEYCEWSVQRDGDAIVGVTFTTEVPEYYSALWDVDRERVLELYRTHVSRDVELDDLHVGGRYDPRNNRNVSIDGPIMHLSQEDNTLGAAVTLAGQATVLRERNGQRVTEQQALVKCGALGNPFRSSDPQIASAVNGRAALGELITLADPLGLYIDRLVTAGMRFPDGVSASDCWTVERGGPGHAVRARFELPPGTGTVSDVTIHGTPIVSGAQLADRVVVRLGAISHSPETQTPRTEGCTQRP